MHRLRSHQSLTRIRLSPRDALVLMGGTDVDVEMPFAERAAALRGMHGFVCRCERCSVQRSAASLQARLSRMSAASDAPAAARTEALDALAALAPRALSLSLYTDAAAICRAVLATSVRGVRSAAEGMHHRERRADCLLRLGGALQRLHEFDEARHTWMRASDEHPEHDELRKEAEAARAYAVTPSPPSSRKAVARPPPPPPPPPAVAYVSRAPAALRVHLSAAPLLRPDECAQVISLCEAHAAAQGGWSTQRHTTVPTTDLEVHAVPAVCALLTRVCATTIFPFLEAAYGTSMGATTGRLRIWDAFVVRYDARAQRSLPTHQDDSHLSLTIALNAKEEYDGGGTSFEAPLTRAAADNGVLGDDDDQELALVRPEMGHVVAFPGSLRHGGAPVTRGVRYIVAAFLWISGDEEE